MAALREIKERMDSIQSTMKITNAMYMISSTKINYAKQALANVEPYFYSLQVVMNHVLQNLPDDFKHPLIDDRDYVPEGKGTVGVVCVTADKGLAGSYNHNVIRMTEQMLAKSDNPRLYVVGEVGRHYFAQKHMRISEHFSYAAQKPTLPHARQIASRLLERFGDGTIDEAYVVYTRMENSVTFTPDIIQLLPLYRLDKNVIIAQQNQDDTGYQTHFAFGSTPAQLLDTLIAGILEGSIYSALVESYAAEHYSRMRAMESANKNGEALVDDLSTQYNRLRQAKITQEITEVAAGAKARKKQMDKKKLKKKATLQERSQG